MVRAQSSHCGMRACGLRWLENWASAFADFVPSSNCPDPCSESHLYGIWSNWWLSSSATANNVNTLKLPQSISVLLNMLQTDYHRDCQDVHLHCQHFQVVSLLWCRSKAMSNPKCAFSCYLSGDPHFLQSLYLSFLSNSGGTDGIEHVCYILTEF